MALGGALLLQVAFLRMSMSSSDCLSLQRWTVSMRSSNSPASKTGSGLVKGLEGSDRSFPLDEGESVGADTEWLKISAWNLQINFIPRVIS